MSSKHLSRRSFLGLTSAALMNTQFLEWNTAHGAPIDKTIRFGMSTDIHKDIMFDADERLKTFMDDMATRNLDFVIDLGDFCVPRERNKGFRDLFHSFEGPHYHVLGNHEIDGGYSWQDSMDFLGMDAPYYSFDQGGCHFVVVDGNNKPAGHTSGYARYIGQEQLDWLAADLAQTKAPTLVFSHQSLHDAPSGCVENFLDVQKVLEESEATIIACLCGHRHLDELSTKNGIHYININSMSYHWVGSKYKYQRYDEKMDEAFPHMKHTIPYTKPLYTVVTITPKGELIIEGQSGDFVSPNPKELGMSGKTGDGIPIKASISNRQLRFE